LKKKNGKEISCKPVFERLGEDRRRLRAGKVRKDHLGSGGQSMAGRPAARA